MKTAIVILTLLICGCKERQEPIYTKSWGVMGETDSTVIGYRILSNGNVERTRYLFNPKDYDKAMDVAQLSGIPFDGLNPMAQKDYIDGLRYMVGMKSLPVISEDSLWRYE